MRQALGRIAFLRLDYCDDMKLLLIEDDLKLADHLADSLLSQGFAVTTVSDREALLTSLQSPFVPEVIVMDRIISGFDSKHILPQMRTRWSSTPILVLSAISTPNERTELLNLGADDYLGKPFATHELIARIRVQLRRGHQTSSNFIQIGNVVIDLLARVVSVGGRSINLPAKEFALLRTLAASPSRIWSKDDLLDYVWGQNQTVDTNVVESTVANLRKRLTQIGASVAIRNLRNAGYWIAA